MTRPIFFFATLLALGLGLFAPQAALAYYPCNGAGPGEIIVGMAPNGPGMPDTPLCEYVGGDDGYDDGYSDGGGGYDAAPSGYWVERFGAVAWGHDSTGAPTYTWYINASSEAEAESGALAECAAAGYGDCDLGPAVANGSIAIALGSDGVLYGDWGADSDEARRKALRLCRGSSKGCQIEQILDSPSVWINN